MRIATNRRFLSGLALFAGFVFVFGGCAAKRPKFPPLLPLQPGVVRLPPKAIEATGSLTYKDGISSYNADIYLAFKDDPFRARINITGPLGINIGDLYIGPTVDLYLPFKGVDYRATTATSVKIGDISIHFAILKEAFIFQKYSETEGIRKLVFRENGIVSKIEFVDVDTEVAYSDIQEINGAIYPKTIFIVRKNQSLLIELDQVAIDGKLDDKLFQFVPSPKIKMILMK